MFSCFDRLYPQVHNVRIGNIPETSALEHIFVLLKVVSCPSGDRIEPQSVLRWIKVFASNCVDDQCSAINQGIVGLAEDADVLLPAEEMSDVP